jgi:hypothetical protein
MNRRRLMGRGRELLRNGIGRIPTPSPRANAQRKIRRRSEGEPPGSPGQARESTCRFKRSKLARPYIERLMNLSRFT